MAFYPQCPYSHSGPLSASPLRLGGNQERARQQKSILSTPQTCSQQRVQARSSDPPNFFGIANGKATHVHTTVVYQCAVGVHCAATDGRMCRVPRRSLRAGARARLACLRIECGRGRARKKLVCSVKGIRHGLLRGVIGMESTPEDRKSSPLCAVLRREESGRLR
jgi:hypothetical protein